MPLIRSRTPCKGSLRSGGRLIGRRQLVRCRQRSRIRRQSSIVARDRRFSEGILDQAPQCAHTVFPLDFLSFFIGAPPVADAHFVDAKFPLGNLYGYLRLETEAFFLERNRLDNLAAKSLITGLHIAEIDIREGVRKKSG